MVSVLPWAVGVAALGGLYALDRVAHEVVRPRPRRPDISAHELGLGFEDLEIRSGAHTLRGWLLSPRGGPAGPVVLLAHGWGASYGTLLRLAEPLVSSGHQVVLFDVRGHGRNAEVEFATVRDFRDDVLAVARWAQERFPDRRRVLVGHSLGGAAGVLAADAGAPLDALVLIASPADVLEVTASYLVDRGLPGDFMVFALRPFWWWRLGSTFRELVPERKIGRLRLPILILQPADDRRVSRDHAERLARAAGRPVHIIEGTGHTDVLGAAETLVRVREFLREVEG